MLAWLKGNDDLCLLEIKGILSQGMILIDENANAALIYLSKSLIIVAL